MGIVSDKFEPHREKLEEDYELAMENKIVCSHCGEIKDWSETMTSVSEGTICFSCLHSN